LDESCFDFHSEALALLPIFIMFLRQAMNDFHTMFPSLEKEVIECVLRSNNGHVDSTIDQLLQISKESPNSHK